MAGQSKVNQWKVLNIKPPLVVNEYAIIPVPKPRMTQRDAWLKPPRKGVAKYWAFKEEVQLRKLAVAPEGTQITFIIPMPKSWAAKKKREYCGKPHQQTPDIDNLIKALLDAIHEQDKHIWSITASKIWGYSGAIIIGAAK